MGKRVHVDAKEAFVSVPDALLGEVLIQTAEADAAAKSEGSKSEDQAGPGPGSFLSFHLSEPAFVALLVPHTPNPKTPNFQSLILEPQPLNVNPDRYQVPAPTRKASWAPFWIPDLLGGANLPDNPPTYQSTNQPTNQPTNKQTNQPTNQPINQPNNQPTKKNKDRPTNQPTRGGR